MPVVGNTWPPNADALNRLNADSQLPAFHDDTAGAWTSAYATVSGHLPLEALPPIDTKAQGPLRVVRCQVDVAAAGKVDLVTGGPIRGIWLDATPLDVAPRVTVDLSAGVHTIALVLDNRSNDPVRLELADVPGSPVQVQLVGGK